MYLKWPINCGVFVSLNVLNFSLDYLTSLSTVQRTKVMRLINHRQTLSIHVHKYLNCYNIKIKFIYNCNTRHWLVKSLTINVRHTPVYTQTYIVHVISVY